MNTITISGSRFAQPTNSKVNNKRIFEEFA